MKKSMAAVTLGFLLVVGAGWAQNDRTHTRPPYSGPRKHGKDLAHVRPRGLHHVQKKGGFGKGRVEYKAAH